MKVLTSGEMGAADRAAFERLAIPSRAVMESAGRVVAQVIVDRFPGEAKRGTLVLCGGGNNGGDGLVTARTLQTLGLPVVVVIFRPKDELAGDVAANAESFVAVGGSLIEIEGDEWRRAMAPAELGTIGVVVDALYGTGLRGPVRGAAAEVIQLLNDWSADGAFPVVSIDVPSGVEADSGKVAGEAVNATVTIALQCLKVGQVLFPGAAYCGETWVADIGIPQSLPEISGVKRDLLTEVEISAMLASAAADDPETHKGERGHLLVIGGGSGHFGAVKLSAQAALVSGAGLVTMLLPKRAAEQLSPTLDELMCASLADDEQGNFQGPEEESLAQIFSGKDALVVGPGLGQTAGAASLLLRVFELSDKFSIPLVVDADALNLLAADSRLRDALPTHAVLTPHPGEMARLLGCGVEDVQHDRLGAAQKLCAAMNCCVVLKGARTVIACNSGELMINPAAVATLATAGSGDVLAGVIGAFLARGLPAEEAAAVAVFLHGAAGEVLAEQVGGQAGIVASDIGICIPLVINALCRQKFSCNGMLRPVLPGSLHLTEVEFAHG